MTRLSLKFGNVHRAEQVERDERRGIDTATLEPHNARLLADTYGESRVSSNAGSCMGDRRTSVGRIRVR